VADVDALIETAEQQWLEGWSTGPQVLKVTGPGIGDPAPDFELADQLGGVRSLSSFWSDGPALVLFWRHYGCGCGFDRAGRLREELPEYRELGANVVIVGQGEPERALLYGDTHDLDVPVLCDPDEVAYRAYGLPDFTVAQVFFDTPEEYWSCPPGIGHQLMKERREGGRPMVDNPWLSPGEFVIDTDGIIRLAYRYQYCEDFPDPRVLTTALHLAKT
jgi:peroxiredoxin